MCVVVFVGRAQGAAGPSQPVRVDDLVGVAQGGRVEAGVEAVDLPLEAVGVDVADGEHPAQRPDVAARRAHLHQASPHLGQLGLVTYGEAQVVETATFEHPRPGRRHRRRPVADLEHVEHDVAGEDDGLAAVPGTGGQHQGGVEADRLLVAGAVDVEVGGDHGDVVDAARPAGLATHRPAIS